MKYEKGFFRVVRNCCTSGGCVECRGFRGPVEIEQASGYSEDYARFVANNWSSYRARVEPMEGRPQ